jgi:glycosyltransferase involved in cell wall biosynthesis
MRVLLIYNSKSFGGAARYTVDIARRMGAAGHDVVFVCSPGDPAGTMLEGSCVRVCPTPMGMAIGWHAELGWLNNLLFLADLWMNPLRRGFERHVRALQNEKPFDVIHVQFIKERLWIGRIARALGVPVVWTVHSPLEPWMKRGLVATVTRTEAVSVRRVIAVCRATADDLQAFGLPSEKIKVVYNGLDVAEYAGGSREATRKDLAVRDELMVLVPARPHKEKGIDVLLDAVAVITATGFSIRVFVAGESRRREDYALRAAQRGLDHAVSFLGHRQDMSNLYAGADVVCLPSAYEGLPYAISEAMAAGLPVVATAVGGVPEMVVDGVTGILVPVGDHDRLAEALRELDDPALRDRMGRAGYRRAAALFSWESMVAGTQAVYAAARTAGE